MVLFPASLTTAAGQGWGNWFGALIQSYFGWAQYNRDSFADNVSMRQAQQYQKKNYNLSWITVARDDIRDMMGISVNRINNYMVVSTLILSVAAGGMMSIHFNDDDPDFLVNAFFNCTGMSIIYLVLSIMFGVKGQNCAFTNTMKLLTYEVRPENPAEYNHDYMKQVQHIEKLGCFQMFRLPGMRPKYNIRGCKAQLRADSPGTAAEDSTPVETLEIESFHLWYLTKFWNFTRLWMPYDTYGKFCMGLGIIALGHASAYFSLAKLITDGRHMSAFSACCLTFAFEYLVAVVTLTNFKSTHRAYQALAMLVLMAGPCAGSIAAFTESPATSRLCVPICFFCHTLYYFVAFFMSHNDHNDAKMVNQGDDLWTRLGHDVLEAPDTKAPTSKRPAEDGIFDGDGSTETHKPAEKYSGMKTEGATWPTETEEFERKVRRTNLEVTGAVRCTMLVSFFLWFVMLLWAVQKFLVQADWRVPRGVLRESLLQWKPSDVTVQWGSPLFHPHAIACSDDAVFLADRFHVYQLTDGKVTPSVCQLNSTIKDLRVSCDDEGCRPLALLRDSSVGTVAFDCKHEKVVPAEETPAFEQSETKDFAEMDSQTTPDISPRRVEVEPARPGSSRFVVFNPTSVETLELESHDKLGTWEAPSDIAPIISGCAYADATKALILTRSKDGDGPRLVQVSLPQTEQFSRKTDRRVVSRHKVHDPSLTLGVAMLQSSQSMQRATMQTGEDEQLPDKEF